ncbi:hypothetical protein [Bacillus thuringiensis]|nr:hypothetical protein [Bacillus thuringiensis]
MKFTITLDVHEEISDVDVVDRIIDGVCEQMQDVNYELVSVEEDAIS